MKKLNGWIIVTFATACFFDGTEADEPKRAMITHASEQILVNGKNDRWIVKQWGEPTSKRRKDFQLPVYHYPNPVPAFDEEWVYEKPRKMEHRLVFFKDGLVTYCLEEWSDF